MARSVILAVCLLAALVAPIVATASSIPAIYAKGSPYEIGFQIGTSFKARFQQFLQDYDLLPKMLIPFYESPLGRPVVDAFEATQSTTYPQYMEELRGMANATGVEFYKIFLLNIREELFLIMQNTSTDKLTTPSCSDVLVHTPTGSIIGHNEDNGAEIIDGAFFQHITPEGSGLAAYTAYTYPLLLAGNAFAFNEHGITVSVNALFPQEIAVGALGRQFLTRDLLNARDINDAIRILTKVGPCASGFSANIGSVLTGEMVNIEMSPGRLVSVQRVDNYSYHFNQYLRLNVSHFPDPSSDHRLARIRQLPVPQSAAGVRAILGDTADKEYPIWRNGAAPDYDAYTLATAIFDLSAATMSVYVLENPALGQPLFTLPITRPQTHTLSRQAPVAPVRSAVAQLRPLRAKTA